MKVFINKTICRFLFLHDISRWHYSARDTFGKYWARAPFSLSIKENQALQDWIEFNKNYFKNKNDFILKEILSDKIQDKYHNKILNIFNIFEPRFKYHFDKQYFNMKKIVEYIQSIKNPRLVQKTFHIYGLRPKLTPIYIAMSYKANKSAGGMTLNERIILQFGDYELQDDNSSILNVLFHELTHQGSFAKYIPNDYKIKLPYNFSGNVNEYVDEIIHKTFWSEIGLFSQIQFGWTEKQIIIKINLLLKNLSSPYKDMIEIVIYIRKYLSVKFNNNPEFEFNSSIVKEILFIIKSASGKETKQYLPNQLHY